MMIVPSQAGWQSTFPATPLAAVFTANITAHASSHTKGDYVELIASTTYDSYGFWLHVSTTAATTTQTDQLLDIAVGAAGSEVVILPDILAGWRDTLTIWPLILWVPIFIKKGSRVAARNQALISADTANVGIVLNGGASGPNPIFTGCDAYGINAAASQGTSHTPGNSGSESTDASIGSTTSRAYGAVLLLSQGTLADTNTSNVAYHWEVTIGGLTIAEWYLRTGSSEATMGPFPPCPFNVRIPAATQLQVQAECSGTAEAQDVALYCFY